MTFKTTPGQAQKHKKVRVFLKATLSLQKKKNTDFLCFCACPGVVLDIFGQPGPLQTDIFWGGGVPPSSSFLSAPASPLRQTFFVATSPALFLTLGKVSCHRHLGEGGRLRLTFFWERGGGVQTHKPTKPNAVSAGTGCHCWNLHSPSHGDQIVTQRKSDVSLEEMWQSRLSHSVVFCDFLWICDCTDSGLLTGVCNLCASRGNAVSLVHIRACGHGRRHV